MSGRVAGIVAVFRTPLAREPPGSWTNLTFWDDFQPSPWKGTRIRFGRFIHMAITGMAFTLYPVGDIDRAIGFYRDTLGIPLGLRFGNVYAEFVTPDGAVFGICKLREDMLSKPEFPMNVGAPGAGKGLALEVDDLPAELAKLTSKGVAVREVTETPVCRMTTIDDPDGNTVIIHHRHAPEPAIP